MKNSGGGVMENIITPEELIALGLVIGKLLLILVFGLAAIKIVLKVTNKLLSKSNTDPILYTFIKNVLKVIIVITMITMGLGVLGIQLHTIIAVVGAAGAAIALALRDSLANIAGGVMIIITKPFSKDDFIDIGDVSGKVDHIDLFLTTLKTFDNKTITIPNGIVNTSVLINHSQEEERRVDCTFSIGYGDDIALAKEIMKNVCTKNPSIYKDPAPVMGVANHGESALQLDLKVWCSTDDYWDVKYFLEENIKLAFDEAGINIPYPQMDVHIKKYQ